MLKQRIFGRNSSDVLQKIAQSGILRKLYYLVLKVCDFLRSDVILKISNFIIVVESILEKYLVWFFDKFKVQATSLTESPFISDLLSFTLAWYYPKFDFLVVNSIPPDSKTIKINGYNGFI